MVDETLADHPEEERLRQAEREMADTIEELAAKAATALREHNRTQAVVVLAQMAQTADLARHGQAAAINDQMKASKDR